jgi:hypothetical protein
VQVEPEVTIREEFMKLDDASPGELLSAQSATSDWMTSLGIKPDSEIDTRAQTLAARNAFNGVVTMSSDEESRIKLLTLKTPEAVRHLTGMLAAYDWEFVNMAKELRGYTVAMLVEETKSTNANIRLKALGLLGKVTEVGLFTDKIEIKKTEMSDAEVEQRIKDKLNKFMGVIDVVDIATSDVDLPENGSSFKLTPEETPDEPVKTDDADKA